MIGHPGETEDDVQALVDLTLEARRRFRRRLVINATPFVPKAHTPFQWEGMTEQTTFERRQKAIQRGLSKHNVSVRADSPQWAAVQGVLARGDRRLAPVLLSMERLSISAFTRALAEHGLSMGDFLDPREPGAPQPWDIVESGVSSSYFLFEQRHAQRARDRSQLSAHLQRLPELWLVRHRLGLPRHGRRSCQGHGGLRNRAQARAVARAGLAASARLIPLLDEKFEPALFQASSRLGTGFVYWLKGSVVDERCTAGAV